MAEFPISGDESLQLYNVDPKTGKVEVNLFSLDRLLYEKGYTASEGTTEPVQTEEPTEGEQKDQQ
jgi:hypothetical protein